MKIVCSIYLAKSADLESELNQLLAEFEYIDEGRELALDDRVINLEKGELRIGSSFSKSNSGFTFTILYNGLNVSTFMCNWVEMDPYLGIYIEALGYIEIFLKKK